jgi:hypothetical protein
VCCCRAVGLSDERSEKGETRTTEKIPFQSRESRYLDGVGAFGWMLG